MKVPFDKEGRMLSWTPPGHTLFRENFEFEATMEVVGIRRGRSAANFILRSGSRDYSMFMGEMIDMIKATNISAGVVSGVWTFCKRGTNYSLRFVR
jgi:hypothetical protein